MFYVLAPSFSGLAPGSRATLQIPSYRASLGRILLTLGGALTKANITEIVVRVGSRIVFGPVTGAQLDAVQNYRGMAARADTLCIDFTEYSGLSVGAKEVGAIDLPSVREPVFVEVQNSAGAAVTLSALVGYTAVQFSPEGNTPSQNRQEQLIHKLLRYNVPSSGTRVTWLPNLRGALVKRVHFLYTGTDFTASANGNITTVECRKNGAAVWDRVTDLQNRFLQAEQRKVPQSRIYTLDFVHDDVFSAALKTSDARSLEFNLELGAVDTITALVECLDLPRNL